MTLADQERLRQWLAQVCVIGMISLSITAPGIVFSSSLPYFKIDQLLIPVVLAVYVWMLLAGIARPFRLNGLFLVGILYFICNVVSIVYGAALLGHPVILRDFYDLPKVLLPVAFFTIAFEAELSEPALRRLLLIFSVAVLLVCFYAWAQFLRLSFTDKLNAYYTESEIANQALEYGRRVYATMGNANGLGILMTWCVVIFVLATLFRVGSRIYYSLVAFACLVTLVMTASRYGLVSLITGLILIIALASSSGRKALPRMAFVLLLLPVVAWTYQTVASSNARTFARYQALANPLQVDSLRDRLDYLWPTAWGDIRKSPIVGHGPGKSFLWVGVQRGGYIDSEYFNVLREHGFLGLLVFLGYYFYPLYLIYKGLRAGRSVAYVQLARVPAQLTILYASFIMGVLALVMDIGMATFYALVLQGFLWLWLGLGARLSATIREPLSATNVSLPVVHPLKPQRAY